MTRVSVIASVHNDRGKADAASLVAILDELKPSVLFLEQPPSGFANFCRTPSSRLETRAACYYNKVSGASLIPIDLEKTPPFTKDQLDQLFEEIGNQSPEYSRLETIRDQYTDAAGFAFLNSQSHFNLCIAIGVAEQAAIRATGRETVAALYETWCQANLLREQHMIATIVEYVRGHPVSNGAFIVGAAHIVSLFGLARALSPAASGIQWDFLGLSDAPSPAPSP